MGADMQGKITKRTVDATKPGERDTFLWDAGDGAVKGFGLKVTPGGGKVYVLQYRMGGRGASTRRYTIGRHGSPWTPDTARDEARRLLRMVEDGTDPQASKIEERREQPPAPAVLTVAKLAERFIAEHIRANNRAPYEAVRIVNVYIVPAWGTRPAASITKRDVNTLVSEITTRGAAVQANRVLAKVKKLFAWAAEQDLIDANPAASAKPTKKETARDRVLSDAELVEVWQALDAEPYPFGPLTKLLMLTAQRRDEVAGMRWSELDLDRSMWTIPRERAKNDRAHEVPLSDTAVAVIRTVPKMQDADGRTIDLLFSTTGSTAVSGFGRAKDRLDAAILRNRRRALEEAGSNPNEAQPMPGWTYHDIRRTVTTGLARIGIAPHVADRILNHVAGSIRGVAAVYNRHGYIEERRAALDAWASQLHQIVTGAPPSNVVPLRRSVA